jgi:hypothetical protein
MRTFLVNFIYTSASHSYNADFVSFTQETFPTSHEIYKHIKSTAVARGLAVQGPILWTGITELSENDERQFNFVEECYQARCLNVLPYRLPAPGFLRLLNDEDCWVDTFTCGCISGAS